MKKNMMSLALFICIIAVFIYGLDILSGKAVEEGAVTLEKAILRASVQCYSVEGRYPSSVEYLVDNYGIQIDEKKYVVFYEGFASNVMPDITVALR